MSGKSKQILKAAENLFASGRYHEVTLDDICKKAGVGKGTVYRYFENKEDLFWQVIASGLDDLAESLEAVAEQEDDPHEGLCRATGCIADFFTARRSLFRLVWRAQFRGSEGHRKLRDRWHRKDQKALAVLAGFIEKGMEDGRYKSDLPAAAAARLLLGMIRTALRHRGDLPADGELPDMLVRLMEDGLRGGCGRTSKRRGQRRKTAAD